MPDAPVLVFGATGFLGRFIVDALRDQRLPVRVTGRTKVSVQRVFGYSVEPAVMRLDDPTTFEPVLKGVETVVLIRPRSVFDPVRAMGDFVRRAARDKRIVLVSDWTAPADPLSPHRALEKLVMAHTSRWTILRPGPIAQALIAEATAEATKSGRILLPMGDLRMSIVDARDVGESVAKAVVDPTTAGFAYSLMGPSAVDMARVADVAASSAKMPVVTVQRGLWHWLRQRLAAGARLLHLFDELRRWFVVSRSAGQTRDEGVKHLLGRPPRDVTPLLSAPPGSGPRLIRHA